MLRILQREYWIVNEYDEKVAKIISASEANRKLKFIHTLHRRNPEEIWHNRLFYSGILLEAVAIIYFVGFQTSVNGDEKITLASIIRGDYLKVSLYTLT